MHAFAEMYLWKLLGRSVDPKAAVVSRRKPPWNVLSHKPPQNF